MTIAPPVPLRDELPGRRLRAEEIGLEIAVDDGVEFRRREIQSTSS